MQLKIKVTLQYISWFFTYSAIFTMRLSSCVEKQLSRGGGSNFTLIRQNITDKSLFRILFLVCLLFIASYIVNPFDPYSPLNFNLVCYISFYRAYLVIISYVTLSHLRSKEITGIHKPCIPHSNNSSATTEYKRFVFKCNMGTWWTSSVHITLI